MRTGRTNGGCSDPTRPGTGQRIGRQTPSRALRSVPGHAVVGRTTVRNAVGGIALAVALVATALSPAHAQQNRVVFYSGFDEAGIDVAAPIATHEFVHTRDSDEWETYTASTTCATHKSDDFEPGTANVLVGWSIGRLGPIYFLAQSRNRWDEINTIWLLDPGDEGRMTGSPENGNCDDELPAPPSEYLRQWLLEDTSRNLVILSGALSESDGRAGVERFYLADLDTPQLYAQTRLCLIDETNEAFNHDNRLVQFFMPFTTGTPVCPPSTERLFLPGQPVPVDDAIGSRIANSQWRSATGREGAVVRLYGAVFARLPDQNGFDFWVDDSRGLFEMANEFVVSDEFVLTYGALSDDEFTVEIYQNVLDRDPDAAGLAYWRNRLATDLDRPDLVVFFSDSPEFRELSNTG